MFSFATDKRDEETADKYAAFRNLEPTQVEETLPNIQPGPVIQENLEIASLDNLTADKIQMKGDIKIQTSMSLTNVSQNFKFQRKRLK